MEKFARETSILSSALVSLAGQSSPVCTAEETGLRRSRACSEHGCTRACTPRSPPAPTKHHQELQGNLAKQVMGNDMPHNSAVDCWVLSASSVLTYLSILY